MTGQVLNSSHSAVNGPAGDPSRGVAHWPVRYLLAIGTALAVVAFTFVCFVSF